METETKRFYYNITTDRVQFEIRSAPCVRKTVAARAALVEVLKACVENHNLLHCDTELLEKATLTHDGNRWIFRSEANVMKPLENL